MTILITDGRYILADKIITISADDRLMGERVRSRTTIDNNKCKILRVTGSDYYTFFAGAGNTEHLGIIYEMLNRGLTIHNALNALLVVKSETYVDGILFSKELGMLQFETDGSNEFDVYSVAGPQIATLGSGALRIGTMNKLVRDGETLTALEAMVLLQHIDPQEFGLTYLSYADTVTGELRDLVKINKRQRELMLPKIKAKLLI